MWKKKINTSMLFIFCIPSTIAFSARDHALNLLKELGNLCYAVYYTLANDGSNTYSRCCTLYSM